MLDLVTDRTQIDAGYADTLFSKIATSGLSSLTAEELAAWNSGAMKGKYEYTAWNRVGNAVVYLANLLTSYGYSVTVSAKTDWTASDTPTAAQMATYLSNVAAIKARFYGTTTLPAAMDYIDHEDANNIELLLKEIETNINNMVASLWRCGELRGGEQ